MKSLRYTLHAAGVCFGILLWLASCSFHTRYSESAQVPTSGWLLQDTLFFPVQVVDSATVVDPIAIHMPYSLNLGVRHTNEFPYQTLRLQLSVEYLDENYRPIATLITQDILAPLTDDEGKWNGRTWGSFYEKELTISPLSLSFPNPGTYRILLLPKPQQAPLPGLESLTLTIPD